MDEISEALKSYTHTYIYVLGFALLFFLSMPAHAEETAPAKDSDLKILFHTYAPEPCEFSVSLPEEPLINEQCEVTAQGEEPKCFDKATYTHTFGLDASVRFSLICNEIDEDIRNNYNGTVMEETLRAMTDRSVVRTYNTSFTEEEHFKHAGLVGEGLAGQSPTIYIAQLWIGSKSALSVEAELVGELSEADALFSDILKSVHYSAVEK